MADGGRGGPPKRVRLFIPGPCQVSGEVLQAMAQPSVAHYGPDWIEFYQEVVGLLKLVFQTSNDLFIVPGPGSASTDMAIGSLLSPGETIVVGANGLFGERLGVIATACGLRVVSFTAPQGHPLDPEELERVLAREPDARAVAVVHHETTTTVVNPVRELAEVTHQAGLPIIVDAISSLGGIPLPVDEWSIDVCLSVANKCLECPPGLALISVGPRAWDLVDRNESQTHGWYLNLRTWRQFAVDWADWHPYPVTQPTHNVEALWTGLRRIVEEGLDARFARYRQAAWAVRQGMREMGFELLVEDAFASPVATAVSARPEFEVSELQEYLTEAHNILVAGGIGPLRGKIFRVGHMGEANTRPFLMELLFGVEMFLRQRGIDVPVGAGLVGLAGLEERTGETSIAGTDERLM